MIEIRHERVERLEDSGQAYDRIYRERPIRHLDSFYVSMLNELNVRPGDRLLDVSCGVGSLLWLAAKRGAVAFGIDLSAEAIGAARQLVPSAGLVVGDAEALPWGAETFDRVANVGSVEHYLHPDRGIAEMARVLRPDGLALVMVPNSFGWQHVLYVWRHGRVFDDGQPIQRYADRAHWERLLVQNGLRVERVAKYERERPVTRADWLWYLRRPTKLVRMLTTWLVPLDACNSFVFVCRKAAGR